VTDALWPLRERSSVPFTASHTFASPNHLSWLSFPAPPVRRRLPSGDQHTLLTPLVCPLRVSASCPVAASHTTTVLSDEAEARRLPSGDQHTLLIWSVCPLSSIVWAPLVASHTRTSPWRFRPPALARRLPSGDQHTL